MTFSFNTNIPAAPNNPSVDQPDMIVNNQSTNGIIAVDHITFNTANGGQHKQVTFNNKNVPVAQTDPQSVLYTDSGVASTVSQLLFRNQNIILPISALRAFGNFITAIGAVVPSNSYNVSTIVGTAAGANDNYAITLTANATSSDNVTVLILVNRAIPNFVYTFTGNVLTISIATPSIGTLVNFAIYQY